MEELTSWAGFVAAVWGTSVISGMVGMIGGMVLLALLGLWIPPAALLPLHGCIQVLSNGTRIGAFWRSVDWPQVAWFGAGAFAGAGLGLLGIPALPAPVLGAGIGLGCLAAVWAPLLLPSAREGTRGAGGRPQTWSILSLGSVTTFLSLGVGTTGPLVDAFLINGKKSKESILGTRAAFQLLTHGFKVLVFVFGGFALTAWGVHLLAALPAAVLGNRMGQALAGRVPLPVFLLILRILVTGLAATMIVRALG